MSSKDDNFWDFYRRNQRAMLDGIFGVPSHYEPETPRQHARRLAKAEMDAADRREEMANYLGILPQWQMPSKAVQS